MKSAKVLACAWCLFVLALGAQQQPAQKKPAKAKPAATTKPAQDLSESFSRAALKALFALRDDGEYSSPRSTSALEDAQVEAASSGEQAMLFHLKVYDASHHIRIARINIERQTLAIRLQTAARRVDSPDLPLVVYEQKAEADPEFVARKNAITEDDSDQGCRIERALRARDSARMGDSSPCPKWFN